MRATGHRELRTATVSANELPRDGRVGRQSIRVRPWESHSLSQSDAARARSDVKRSAADISHCA